MSSDLAATIFPSLKAGAAVSQDAVLPALTELQQQLEGPCAMQHTDLILRYAGYCLGLRESSTGLLRVLQFLVSLFDKMHSENCQLQESEVLIVIPHLIEKSGRLFIVVVVVVKSGKLFIVGVVVVKSGIILIFSDCSCFSSIIYMIL